LYVPLLPLKVFGVEVERGELSELDKLITGIPSVGLLALQSKIKLNYT
jgi:hypothetical protein